MSNDSFKIKAPEPRAETNLAKGLLEAKRPDSAILISFDRRQLLSDILNVAQITIVSLGYGDIKDTFGVTDPKSYQKFINNKIDNLYKASDLLSGKAEEITEIEARRIIREISLFEQFLMYTSKGEPLSVESELQNLFARTSLLEIRGIIF